MDPVPNVDATTADTPTAPSEPPRSTAPLTAPDTTPGELETKLDDADGLVIEGSAEADDTHGGTVNPGTPSAAGAPAAAASIRKPRRHTPSGYVVHASARVPDPREHPRLPWHDVHMCVTAPAAVAEGCGRAALHAPERHQAQPASATVRIRLGPSERVASLIADRRVPQPVRSGEAFVFWWVGTVYVLAPWQKRRGWASGTGTVNNDGR